MALADNKVKIQALLDGINALPVAGSGEAPVLQEKTVTPSKEAQSITPDAGYDGLSKVMVNAIPTATQATPNISVDSAGLITASATQTAGYVSAGTKSATRQLTAQAAQTITPGTTDKTIASGRYLTGTQTIKGDANLVAGNIKSGVSIFGVTGTLEAGSGGSGGSVETCTFTVNGGSIIGATVLNNGAITTVTDTSYTMTTLDNVVCGSIVYIMGDQTATYSLTNCRFVFGDIVGAFSPFEAIAIDAGVTSASVTVTDSGSVAPPD